MSNLFDFQIMEAVFLTTPEAKQTQEKGDTAQYIIRQNDVLHADNQKLRANLNKMKSKASQLSDDLGRQEQSTTYLRGLVKNFAEMDRLRKELLKIQTKQMNADRTQLSEGRYQLINELRIAAICLLLATTSLLILGLFPAFWCIATLAVIVPIEGALDTHFDTILDPRKRLEPLRQRELTEELNALEQAQDHLNDYLDNI